MGQHSGGTISYFNILDNLYDEEFENKENDHLNSYICFILSVPQIDCFLSLSDFYHFIAVFSRVC